MDIFSRKRKRKRKRNRIHHREVQLLALALKLGKIWGLSDLDIFDSFCIKRIKHAATQLNIIISDEEIIEAEKYLKENERE